MVYRFALFLTRDREMSREIAQETARVALSKARAPTTRTEFGIWVRAVARNLVRNALRKRGRNRLFFDNGILAEAESRFVEIGGDRDGAWEARRAALPGCIEKLSESERDLLRQRYDLGRSVRKIARRTGMKPNTLSKRLQRIRRVLRECVKQQLKEE